MKNRKWKVYSSKRVFDSPFVKVRVDRCKTTRGSLIDHYTLELKSFVIVAGFTKHSELLMVREYRHSVKQHLLGLPAGVINPRESPAKAAVREFEEETGYKITRICKLAHWFVIPGKSAQACTLFAGKVGKKTQQHMDETEHIEVKRIRAKRAYQLVKRGLIVSAPMTAAILLLKDRYPKYFK